MPLSGSAFWALVLPVEKTNLVTNPSFERGTAGWGTVNAGTIGTTAAFQQSGAWSGSYAPTSNTTCGVFWESFTLGNGTNYTLSAWVKGQAGVAYAMGIADTGNVIITGTQWTGGGTWHRYSIAHSENTGASRRVVIRKNLDADTNAFYVDGIQVEVGSQTTYFDGDSDGAFWQGQPHNSQSLRSGTYRGGGSVVALADLGLKPDQFPGIGMPPQDITAQSYALLPGAEYQRSRADERPFTLTFSPIVGTTMKDFHATRRRIENAIKADLVSPQQPVRLWYTGGQGTVQIDAVYAGGMEGGDWNGPMAEEGAVKFVAHNPYWETTTQEGTALASRTALGSTLRLAKRDPYGRWGTLGANGSTTDASVNALTMFGGTLYVGGQFGSAAGTRSGGFVFYNTQANTFGTFGGTVEGANGVRALTTDAIGTVYIGGGFTNISGLSNTRHIARYANGFATITGGTTNGPVYSFAWTGGTLVIGGSITAVAGTSTGCVLLWRPAGYGSTTGGTFSTNARGVGVGLDRRVFAVTDVGATTAGGTSINYIAQWFGSWGTMGGGFTSTGVGGASAVASGPNGAVYAVGGFGSAGGGTAENVAQWNGQQWYRMADGVGQDSIGLINVENVYVDQQSGDVYALGLNNANTGARVLPDAHARWNGYVWLPLDIDMAGAISAMVIGPDRTIYVGGAFNGTADAAAVAQVINTGMAEAYPTVKIRNTSGTTVRLYQLGNTFTGDMLYFDLTFEPGEELTLKTEPGQRSFQSSFSGNVFGAILGGSNITGFRLMPGTNYISLFCNSGSVAASMYWPARSDAADGGTVY